MQTIRQEATQKQSKAYIAEREAVKKTMEKMAKELEKPQIKAVFQRLKDK
ncbi:MULTISPECIES: hypothetical protein [unclassified Campylobacter]|nr:MULTISPECIES: hypothetical protein [unclassified Campylobacter]